MVFNEGGKIVKEEGADCHEGEIVTGEVRLARGR